MGRRGAIPKSRSAKVLIGNFRPDRPSSPGITPNPNAKAPRMPANLTPAEKELWKYYGPELSRLGLLDSLSRGPFHVLITLLAHHQSVSEQLNTEGLILMSKRGIPRPHPLLSVQKKLWSSCFAMMKEFGLTPASRQRLGISSVPPPPTSKLAKYLHAERQKEARFFGPEAS